MDEVRSDPPSATESRADTLGIERPRLSVGEGHEHAILRVRREVPAVRDCGQSCESRDAGSQEGDRGGPLDLDRLLDRRPEQLLVRDREEMWKRAVGERGDTHPYVGELLAQP